MGYMGKEAIIAKIPSYNNYNIYFISTFTWKLHIAKSPNIFQVLI